MPRYFVMNPGEADSNGDGRISATELSVSALWLGLFAAGFLLGMVGLFGSWRLPLGPFRLVLFLIDLALTGACIVGCWRHYAVFDRALRWAAADRARAQMLENEDRTYRNSLQDQAGDRISQVDVDMAVDLILTNYYADKPWNRGAISSLSDPKWNLANQALQKAGIRRGKSGKLEPESFDAAFRQYLEWRRKNRSWKVNDEGELINA